MELRLTFQDKVLRLSIRAGKMVLEATIPPLSPHVNSLIPYLRPIIFRMNREKMCGLWIRAEVTIS
ncbi:hypothetical protein HKBW3S06_00252 [Candidatus Hakubella thermalkaliphila]|uniref:Uncharacterized protein n=1 Tax=Candidatus Hakubella thermalkaliphila TaxID=2754717 RepID=A0A6V8P738_9ACTN|nr:hypothetical protein HKBW3S06_00252 [Candidatus Hakubella thermalkaliphila]GFP27454.1 hypothetical protein HKBW3S33_00867 [Candidatus Hakubella thermalkaliphila]